MNGTQRQSALLWFSLAGTIAMVLAVLLRWTLTTGLQCDELLFLKAIELGPVRGLTAEGSSHPPVFRWIVGAFLSSQSPDWLLRTPSILASLLTVVVWFGILQRIIDDDWVVAFLLPLIACNSSWLEVGYQLTPYAFLTLVCSLHCLFWLKLFEDRTFKNGAWFVITGVAPMWTHFYGANVLIADQIIWMCLLWKNRELWRLWLKLSLSSCLLVLPVVPLAIYYGRLIKPYPLVQFDDFQSYFWASSQYLFSQLTLNVDFVRPLIWVWYLIVGVTVLRCLVDRQTSPNKESHNERKNLERQLILCGFFLAGFPATQLHSQLGEKAMWARYAVLATWVHWPILVMGLRSLGRPSVARWVGGLAMAWCLFAFFGINRMQQQWTFDHTPAMAMLSTYAQPTDAFVVQDMDLWVGEFNFDRLWFERYSPVQLPIISEGEMGRFELATKGLSFDSVPDNITRVWVCSDLFSVDALQRMQTAEWKLVKLDDAIQMRPIALFAKILPNEMTTP